MPKRLLLQIRLYTKLRRQFQLFPFVCSKILYDAILSNNIFDMLFCHRFVVFLISCYKIVFYNFVIITMRRASQSFVVVIHFFFILFWVISFHLRVCADKSCLDTLCAYPWLQHNRSVKILLALKIWIKFEFQAPTFWFNLLYPFGLHLHVVLNEFIPQLCISFVSVIHGSHITYNNKVFDRQVCFASRISEKRLVNLYFAARLYHKLSWVIQYPMNLWKQFLETIYVLSICCTDVQNIKIVFLQFVDTKHDEIHFGFKKFSLSVFELICWQ